MVYDKSSLVSGNCRELTDLSATLHRFNEHYGRAVYGERITKNVRDSQDSERLLIRTFSPHLLLAWSWEIVAIATCSSSFLSFPDKHMSRS